MRGLAGHPDADTLADVRAGAISGLRGRRLTAHLAHCPACTSVSERLGEVSSVLASAPLPVLPDYVERRIAQSIAVEAAVRASGTVREDAPRMAGKARALWSRRVQLRPGIKVRLGALVPAAACLVLVIAAVSAGYALTTAGGPAGRQAAGPLQHTGLGPKASSTGLRPNIAGPGLARPGGATFVVSQSGTHYQAAILRSQVSHELSVLSPKRTRSGTVPSASLASCVLHVTGNVRPDFVDSATYQSEPVYVIAVSNRAWVVGRPCPASGPRVITTVQLAAGAA